MVDATIGHAVNLAYLATYPQRADNYNEHKGHAWECFYACSPQDSTAFIISALSSLLTVRTAAPEVV